VGSTSTAATQGKSLCGCCRWCLLLLVGWCEGFYDARVSEALAVYVVLVPFFSLGRGSVLAVLNFDQIIAFVWLYVSWCHSQGVSIGGATCYVFTGNFFCIIGRPRLIRACCVSFGLSWCHSATFLFENDTSVSVTFA